MQRDLFEKVLDRVFSGVYFVDRDRRIIYWNKGAERITGHKKDKVMGKLCFDNILNTLMKMEKIYVMMDAHWLRQLMMAKVAKRMYFYGTRMDIGFR